MQRLYIFIGLFVFLFGVDAQNYINNLDTALAHIKPKSSSYFFSGEGVEKETLFRGWTCHTQGIAYSNKHYYIVRNRPENRNFEQLLIVNDTAQKIVNAITLDSFYNHLGGIQIYEEILAVPFEKKGQNAKINFYSITNPTQPILLNSFITDSWSAICLGITNYRDKYLVARYCHRSGKIVFYHFDKNFNKIAEQTWLAENQNRTNWLPVNEWQDDKQFYENMSLLQVKNENLSSPQYFLIMYRNKPDAIDIFSLSEPDLASTIDIQMRHRIEVSPRKGGFRLGGGYYAKDKNNIIFFSTQRHITRSNTINIF